MGGCFGRQTTWLRESRRARARTLTVIETALASPLVSWVAGSVPACQPVCHQHCLVFSLRPSAFSLYTLSCSGLTCFLYINIFITAQMASFPPFQEQEGSSLPADVLCAGVIFQKKLSLSRTMLWYDRSRGNKWPWRILSEWQRKYADTVKGSTCWAEPLFSYLKCFHNQV